MVNRGELLSFTAMATPTPCEEVVAAARFGAYCIIARPLLLKVYRPGDGDVVPSGFIED